MLAKLFAVAAGCTFAVVSSTRGRSRRCPFLCSSLCTSRKSRAAADQAGIAVLMAVAGVIGVRLAIVAGSGQRLTGRGASAAGENVWLKFENPAPAGFFV
jgi:hypothetical protein